VFFFHRNQPEQCFSLFFQHTLLDTPTLQGFAECRTRQRAHGKNFIGKGFSTKALPSATPALGKEKLP
jgi:hypothetical protein